MAKKYNSPLTSKITATNWQDVINLKRMSVDDIIDLHEDMKVWENTGKKIRGYLKEALDARIDGDDYENNTFTVEFEDGHREGNLDMERLMEEYGEQWIQAHRKEGTDFRTLRVKRKKT